MFKEKLILEIIDYVRNHGKLLTRNLTFKMSNVRHESERGPYLFGENLRKDLRGNPTILRGRRGRLPEIHAVSGFSVLYYKSVFCDRKSFVKNLPLIHFKY